MLEIVNWMCLLYDSSHHTRHCKYLGNSIKSNFCKVKFQFLVVHVNSILTPNYENHFYLNWLSSNFYQLYRTAQAIGSVFCLCRICYEHTVFFSVVIWCAFDDFIIGNEYKVPHILTQIACKSTFFRSFTFADSTLGYIIT